MFDRNVFRRVHFRQTPGFFELGELLRREPLVKHRQTRVMQVVKQSTKCKLLLRATTKHQKHTLKRHVWGRYADVETRESQRMSVSF